MHRQSLAFSINMSAKSLSHPTLQRSSQSPIICCTSCEKGLTSKSSRVSMGTSQSLSSILVGRLIPNAISRSRVYVLHQILFHSLWHRRFMQEFVGSRWSPIVLAKDT